MLRVVATIGVILLHVGGTDFHLPVGEHDWYIAVVFDSLVRWSVPMFVMISGALFLNPAKEITIHITIKKYAARLIKVYLFWYLTYLVINTAYTSLLQGFFNWDAISLVPQFHLWFLLMLAGVYLLIPILRKIAIEEKYLRYSLLLWSGYFTISFLLVREVPQMSKLFVMNWIVGYAGYFLLGYYVSSVYLSKKKIAIVYTLGLLGAAITIGGSFVLSFHRGVDDEKFLFNISPHVVMMSTALFVLVKYNTKNFGIRVTRFAEYVRKDLFGIYLVHGLWLLVFNRPLFRDAFDHTFTLPLITIVIFISSLYTTKLLRLIPPIRKFIE